MRSLVDKESNQGTTTKTADDSKRERTGWKTQANPTDEDNRFEALPKDSDERQEEHGVLLTPEFEAAAFYFASGAIFGLELSGELDAPFVLELGDAEKSSAHDTDDQGCYKTKGAFPNVFGACPFVLPEAVESSDQASTDDETDGKAHSSSHPDLFDSKDKYLCREDCAWQTYLAHELFVSSSISIWSQGLLQEGQENRNDDARLQALSKAYEED